MAILRVKAGPQKGTQFEISQDSHVLGRDTSGEIQILDQGISRRHAEVLRIGPMYFIRDLESRNGTFVNDARITEEILRVGDQIALGNTVLVFEDRSAQLKDASGIFAPEMPSAPEMSPTSTIQLQVTQSLPAASAPESKDTVEERNLEVLLHLSQIISEEKNLSKLFSRVGELLGKSLDADHLYVLGLAEGTEVGDGKIDFEKSFEMLGRYDKDEGTGQAAGVSRGILTDCLRHNRSVLTADASLDQQFNAMESVVMNQLRSVMCVPICALGKSIGCIYLYSTKADAFRSEDLELASAVGIQLGSTIELLKLVGSSDRFFRNSVKTLVSAIEMRTPKDRGRSARIATYCLAVAKELGMSTQDIRDSWLAAMLHDIGSIPMSETERADRVLSETKRNHFARELLKGSMGLEHILPAVEQQRERADGSGSPEGLKADQIHPQARILSICLEFDTLLTDGVDGNELSIKEALLRIRDMADKQHDRQTVNALLIAYRNGSLFSQNEEFFEVPSS
ncbi:MAG: HD domain-containing phosphohydrolase [Planctomycetota bacterium]